MNGADETSDGVAARRGMSWSDLCEELDQEVYLTAYLPAGGTREFDAWRGQKWPVEHSRRHPLRSYDPACMIKPLTR